MPSAVVHSLYALSPDRMVHTAAFGGSVVDHIAPTANACVMQNQSEMQEDPNMLLSELCRAPIRRK